MLQTDTFGHIQSLTNRVWITLVLLIREARHPEHICLEWKFFEKLTERIHKSRRSKGVRDQRVEHVPQIRGLLRFRLCFQCNKIEVAQ